MKLLNVIGAGRVGQTLARLWHLRAVFCVQDVLTARPATAAAAVEFIGAGRAISRLRDMSAADVWLIATPDQAIAESAQQLAASKVLRAGDVVFHCSGALSSEDLILGESGAQRASVHPLKTFAKARAAVRSFDGSWCTAEGDATALALLSDAFERIGGRITRIESRRKVLYHAASVLVCGGLTALMEAGLRTYAAAGLERNAAMDMMAPLARETLENVFTLGTADALTGPVARGDGEIVSRHLESLEQLDVRLAELYRLLASVGVEVGAPSDKIENLRAVLGKRADLPS